MLFRDFCLIKIQPGYHVKPLGDNLFSCQKLGQIVVSIYDRESQDLFPSVLLSLSGEEGYRNNSVSGVGGYFIFDNLFPGSFFLRPLLKVLIFYDFIYIYLTLVQL